MVVISLDISDDTYEEFVVLADFYKKDVEELIKGVIEAVIFSRSSAIYWSEEYKVPLDLRTVVSILLSMGSLSARSLFNKILDMLDAKRLFIPDDMEIDPEDGYIWIPFVPIKGSNTYIHSCGVTFKPGRIRITVNHTVDKNKVSNSKLKRIKEIVENIDEIENPELPEEFPGVECYIDAIEEEKTLTLQIDFIEESVIYTPKIPEFSELFKQILEIA